LSRNTYRLEAVMDITNIILVTENHNGSETNSLMYLLAFIDFVEK